jgi:TonB family protein
MDRHFRSKKAMTPWVFGLPLLALMLAAFAPPDPPPETRSWRVAWQGLGCTLYPRGGRTQPVTFQFRWFVGLRELHLYWHDATRLLSLPPQAPELFLEPGHVRIEDAVFESADQEPGIWSIRLPLAFLERLAAAVAIKIEAEGESVGEVPLADARAAVAELRSCNDDALRRWGVDPVAHAALRRIPKPLGGGATQWFSHADYPPRALRDRRAGMSVARLIVGTDGRVKDCTIVRPSGTQDLDTQTCILYKHRGRFEAALGPDGTPVAAPIIMPAIWQTG